MSAITAGRIPVPKALPERLARTSWKEYLVRFVFGGVITAAVGVIGTAFGPVVAGLFLAFPAILPASLTLMSNHDSKEAAEHAALGATAGSIGLGAFGLAIWQLMPLIPGAIALGLALLAWVIASLAAWMGLKMCFPPRATG